MSKPSPYDNISISEGGRFVRYEWDVHYLTDEQMETVRKHIETLQAENAKLRDELNAEHIVRQNVERENAKLRELVQSFHSAMLCTLDTGMWPTDPEWLERRMRELGVDDG